MMRRATGILMVLALVSCGPGNKEYRTKANDSEFLHRSIKAITDRIVHDTFSPPVASRIYAYASVAAYEAARHMDPNFVTLAGQLHGLDSVPQPDPAQEYSFPLASVQATLKVGTALIFSESVMEEFYQATLTEIRKSGMPDDVYSRSIEYGNRVADHILKWSASDNYKETRSFSKYSIQTDIATWKPTPPAYMDAIEPHWDKIRTFVIDSARQFRPLRPTSFSKIKGSQFYKEANEVYEVGLGLSNEQREIANFWDCNPFVMNVKGHVMFATKKISPGGHWMNITRVACNEAHADFVHAAEAYVLVSLSLADGFISCWEEKYRSNVIRPETYINQYIDENWTPILQTPPFPEYTSGHSVISSAAATALTQVLGSNFAFTDSTETEFGLPPRRFKSFFEASEEAAISRLYGGIHYRPAIENGVKEGRDLGTYVAQHIVTRKKLVVNK